MWDWASFLHYIHSPYLLTGAAISLGLSVGAMLIGLIFGVIADVLIHVAVELFHAVRVVGVAAGRVDARRTCEHEEREQLRHSFTSR